MATRKFFEDEVKYWEEQMRIFPTSLSIAALSIARLRLKQKRQETEMHIKIKDHDFSYVPETGKFKLECKESHFSFHAGKTDLGMTDKKEIEEKILHEMSTKGHASEIIGTKWSVDRDIDISEKKS